MSDDIVTRLRGKNAESGKYPRLLLSEIEMLNEAADEIERLREWNTEVTKLLQQAQVCMDIWQKSEDELIEFHSSNAIEQLTNQADEIERLRAELSKALGRTCRCVNTGATDES